MRLPWGIAWIGWSALAACPKSSPVATSDGGKDAGCTPACVTGLICADQQCVPQLCETAADCPTTFSCVAGFCTDSSCEPPCPAEQTCLNEVCIEKKPGACGTTADCPAGESCEDGFCTDSSCDPACPSGQSCLDLICVPNQGTFACAVPYVQCNSANGSYCANLARNSSNCGGCGQACGPGLVCNGAGICAITCIASDLECDGRCVDPQTDETHCGSCASACPSGELCSAGACAASCAPPFVACGTGAGSYCANVQFEPTNCGGCGRTCAAGELCSDGGCTTTCGTGTVGCAETDGGIACCTPGQTCTPGGCCSPNCTGATCNQLDGCGGVCPGGSCPSGQACTQDAGCVGADCSNPACQPGASEPCGNCGTAYCDSSCQWENCLGTGACAPGSLQSQACGDCGTQGLTCLTTCVWDAGACTGEGVCSPDAGETCNMYGTAVCSDQCAWGSCSCPTGPVCLPNAMQTNLAGGTLTCDACGQWGPVVGPQVLAASSNPLGLVGVNAFAVYYVDFGNDAGAPEMLMQVGLDGGIPTALAVLGPSCWYCANYRGIEFAVVDANSVYWADPDAGQLMKQSAGGSPIPLVTGLAGTRLPFTLFLNDTTLFWVDETDTLFAIPPDGGPVVTLNSGVIDVFPAADSSHLFWTTSTGEEQEMVWQAQFDGGSRLELYHDAFGDGSNSENLVYDATNVYWTDGCVNEAPIGTLLGGSVLYCGNGSSLAPYPLAIDRANEVLYWADTYQTVTKIAVSGADAGTILADNQLCPGCSGNIAVDGTSVYWTDNTIDSGFVVQVGK